MADEDLDLDHFLLNRFVKYVVCEESLKCLEELADGKMQIDQESISYLVAADKKYSEIVPLPDMSQTQDPQADTTPPGSPPGVFDVELASSGSTNQEISDIEAMEAGIEEDTKQIEGEAESEKSESSDEQTSDSDSEQEINDYLVKHRNASTVAKTKQAVARFHDYIEEHYKDNSKIEKLPAKTLNKYLAKFLMNVKTKKGKEYEPDSLSALHRSLDRHLKWENYGVSILRDEAFKTSQGVIEGRRADLKAEGYGNLPNKCDPLTQEQVEILWDKGILGGSCGRSLVDTIWFYFCSAFGWRGCHETKQLKFGDVKLLKDQDGREYLQSNERLSKTRQGGKGAVRPFQPKLWAHPEMLERCIYLGPMKMLI